MKRQMHAVRGHAEIAAEGHNLKLGRGGIREIEFFAQTQQLIAGGRDPDLRGHRTVDMLHMLAQKMDRYGDGRKIDRLLLLFAAHGASFANAP